MKIKSITFDRYGVKIHVSGKTGNRSLRLTASVPLLATSFNMHPQKDNPETPLWPDSPGLPIRYPALQEMIPRSAKRAGIATRVYPHLFRHSRATFLASYLTEAQLCARFGWVQGLEQPGTYVHLSGRDADEAVLELYGIKQQSGEDIKLLLPKCCESCGAVNPLNCQVCMKCGLLVRGIRRPGLARATTYLLRARRPRALEREEAAQAQPERAFQLASGSSN